MTVLELIASWTEEERRSHADLIAECLRREESVKGLNIRAKQEELSTQVDKLVAGLEGLTLAVTEYGNSIESVYLGLMKAEGNA